jgi:hypothetical protein
VSGEDVLDLSADLDFPPCLLMRRMLELLLKLSKQVWGDCGGRQANRPGNKGSISSG